MKSRRMKDGKNCDRGKWDQGQEHERPTEREQREVMAEGTS